MESGSLTAASSPAPAKYAALLAGLERCCQVAPTVSARPLLHRGSGSPSTAELPQSPWSLGASPALSSPTPVNPTSASSPSSSSSFASYSPLAVQRRGVAPAATPLFEVRLHPRRRRSDTHNRPLAARSVAPPTPARRESATQPLRTSDDYLQHYLAFYGGGGGGAARATPAALAASSILSDAEAGMGRTRDAAHVYEWVLGCSPIQPADGGGAPTEAGGDDGAGCRTPTARVSRLLFSASSSPKSA
ncbi:hypothetical protein NESM_000780200 [Novymonas esmeraldas]|uniref:Uncharacterized protein n=1 Tax=Novymonas esmeraldas TaxID=1808958 RepID=A0AAW0EXN8_9TRYP